MTHFQNYNQLQRNLVQSIDDGVEPYENRLELNWHNNAPMMRANQLAMKLGLPTRFNTEAGGVAVWENVDPYFQSANVHNDGKVHTNVYSKLMIKDEAVPHLVPVPHLDYFYAFMYMDIHNSKVDDIRALTESVGYDTMKREAFARCHFTPANLTSLYLIKQIALGHKSLAHAMQEYVVLIPKLAEEEKMGGGLMGTSPGPWHITLTNYLFDL